MGSPGAGSSAGHECSFKILLIGDSAVGKSSLLVSFVAAAPLDEDIAPTIVYDVTKRETFTNLAEVWTKEIEANSKNKDCVKMLVGNKVDKVDERMVTREEGLAFAQECGCLFLESSAKTRENVEKCFEELALKILEVSWRKDLPRLLREIS